MSVLPPHGVKLPHSPLFSASVSELNPEVAAGQSYTCPHHTKLAGARDFLLQPLFSLFPKWLNTEVRETVPLAHTPLPGDATQG